MLRIARPEWTRHSAARPRLTPSPATSTFARMGDLHVVFGASGGAGAAVVRTLAARGSNVRAISRSGGGRAGAGVESVSADATDVAAARDACAGASVVYHCVNVPYGEWASTLPVVMDNLLASAAEAGATLVYCDNLYMYGQVDGPITETTSQQAAGAKGRLRIDLADRVLEAHAAGRVQAAIGRASDFYGPGATNTVAGQLVFPAVAAGGKAHWIGDLDQPHSLNFIDDVARALVTLGSDARAAGSVWHIPAGPAPTGREFIEMAFAVAAKPRKVGVYGRGAIRLVGLFDRQRREILEILHQFERPFVIDGTRYADTFGDDWLTPMPQGLARTLA